MSYPLVLTCEVAECRVPAVKAVVVGQNHFCLAPAADIHQTPRELLRINVCDRHIEVVRANFTEIDSVTTGLNFSNVAAFY